MTRDEQTSFMDFKKRLDESYRSAARSDTEPADSQCHSDSTSTVSEQSQTQLVVPTLGTDLTVKQQMRYPTQQYLYPQITSTTQSLKPSSV